MPLADSSDTKEVRQFAQGNKERRMALSWVEGRI